MEQMYLIEIFIDKVTIYEKDDEQGSHTNKSLIIKVRFGPNVQFIVKEGQLAVNEKEEDIVVTDEVTGRRQYSRTIRIGKSYLFPSYPDTILLILSKFPLEIEVWNDDTSDPEGPIFVGVGNMHWHTQFFNMVRETANPCKIHQPLSIKSRTTIWAECCCVQAGVVDFIVRLSALGGSIITEFQQLLKDPETFVLRTNKAPSMFQCKRIEGDDPNFCMVGSLYETTTMEDPDIVDQANKKIEVCTELQSCGMGGKQKYVCEPGQDPEEGAAKKKYPIDKIRMGDIIGPCGNTNCELAHRVRNYIRNLNSYKKKGITPDPTKPQHAKKVCGKCICKDDRYHREKCPKDVKIDAPCIGCKGLSALGNTCEDKRDREFGTGATPRETPKQTPKPTPKQTPAITPKGSVTRVGYVFNTTQFPDYKQNIFGNCFCSKTNMFDQDCVDDDIDFTATSEDDWESLTDGCSCSRSKSTKTDTKTLESRTITNSGTNNPLIYNVKTNTSKSLQCNSLYGSSYRGTINSAGTSTAYQVYNVSVSPEDKECKCAPKKPSPPCKTFDCDCLAESLNIRSRKIHKPYCPSYKHKTNCPVTMMNEEEELKKADEDEEEVAPLPYGLPPIRLGPCPVLGRPCSVPDGFARMYKNALTPTQPFSYSDDGKVCCSKEYERIKKAIREYTRNDKESDYRCLNKFNVDTERRCCDKEQVLMSLVGKACCGSHKMSIQEKFKQGDKHPPH